MLSYALLNSPPLAHAGHAMSRVEVLPVCETLHCMASLGAKP